MLPTIIIQEQGLRDGLQTLPHTFTVAQKLQWIAMLANAGIRRIQVASFVHPKLVPSMADAEALFAALPSHDGITYSALVLNTKGVQRAITSGVKHLAISLSASHTHSLRNTNKSITDAKTDIAQAIQLAVKHGIQVRAGVQCVLGCRYEGVISHAVVVDLVQHLLSCGAHEIALADSTGMGNPIQLKNLLEKVLPITQNVPLALHLHNTENKGYANVVAALQMGITQFDTAFGGLGGCPFIPAATGNIATEDTVHMLHQMGYNTNIDISKVAQVSLQLEALLGYKLPGLLYNLPLTLTPLII